MNQHFVIELFSPLWWKGLFLSLSVMVFLILAGRWGSRKVKERIAGITGILLMALALSSPLVQWLTGRWNLQWSLPLNLCSLSGLLSGVALLWRKQAAFEVLLYWGLSGATYSLITPEMTLGYSGWNVFDYYVSHAGILFSSLYLAFVFGMRPRAGSWRYVFLLTQVVALFVGIINFAVGANYMYLAQKPLVSNPFFVGDWPWYILGLEVALLLHFFVIYRVFRRAKMHYAEDTATT